MLDKNFTCCFTGHREILPGHAEKLPALIERTLASLVDEGCTTFVTGGALGFDTMAAEAVLKLKKKNPQIKLVVVAPFAGQPQRWEVSQQLKYERIREAADDYICLSAGYSPGCMKRRNKYIVEMSAFCVAYCVRERSGSSQTLAMARENGLEVIQLAGMIV